MAALPRWLPIAVLLAAGKAAAEERFQFEEPHMGTRFRVVLFADSKTEAEAAARKAFDRIAALNRVFSDYLKDSEIRRLMAAQHGTPVKVSDDLMTVLAFAQKLAEQSNGAFDVTLGPHIRNWRRAVRSGHLPSAKEIDAARRASGWRNVRLDPAMHSVTLTAPGMRLDFGGIAKGYAADEALKLLALNGHPRALVAAGGDIAVGDPPPGKAAWPVKVDFGHGPRQSRPLANRAVSTSGDREQFVEIDGVRYSHIVDPRSGLGLVERPAVSVAAPSGLQSDSLATTLCVLGPSRASAFLEKQYPRAEARFENRSATAR